MELLDYMVIQCLNFTGVKFNREDTIFNREDTIFQYH